MKKHLLFLLLFLVTFLVSQAQVSINTSGSDPDASAMLDISSNSKGLLVPRLTSAQRNAIASPADGLLVYDTDSSSFWYYKESTTTWIVMVGQMAYYLNDLSDVKADDNSIFIGAEAGKNDDGTNWNVAVGHESLRDNISGLNNSAFGFVSMTSNTTGNENTALGTAALSLNTTGNTNVAVGYTALLINSTGSENVAVGNRALLQPSRGNQNTAIGSGAGQNSTGGASGNVFLGYNAGKDEMGSNKLYIENSDSARPLIGGDFDADEVDINGDLSVSGDLTVVHTMVYGNLAVAMDVALHNGLSVEDNILVDDSLIVNSAIKFLGGTPGEGKVLTSDLDGNASWADAPSSGAEWLNDLVDARTANTSIYVGGGSGLETGAVNRNTAVGYQALRDSKVGENTAFGYTALAGNTYGANNVGIGSSTLNANTEGGMNVAIGDLALSSNETGSQNTVIGFEAGKGLESSSLTGSVFVGYQAGSYEATDNKLYIENSSSNLPLIGGDFTDDYVDINGDLNVTGNLKIAGGAPGTGKVLKSDADGNASWETLDGGVTSLNDLSDAKNDNSTILIGSSGGADDGANNNTAMGISALNANTTGYNNVAFGGSSLLSSTIGTNNTALGANSMELSTVGRENVAIGSQALYNNAGGIQNTAIGYKAGFGDFNVTSNANVFLGYKAGYFETGDQKLYIDNSDTSTPLIYGDFSTKDIKINGDFRVTSNAVIDGDIQVTSNAEIGGNVKAEEYSLNNAKTATLSVPPAAFMAAQFSSVKTIEFDNWSTRWDLRTDMSEAVVYAPIYLPQGATIKNLKVDLSFVAGSSFYVLIAKQTFGEGWVEDDWVVKIQSDELGTEGQFEIFSSATVSELVDNDIYSYFIAIVYDSNYDENLELLGRGAQVVYEYSTLNH